MDIFGFWWLQEGWLVAKFGHHSAIQSLFSNQNAKTGKKRQNAHSWDELWRFKIDFLKILVTASGTVTKFGQSFFL